MSYNIGLNDKRYINYGCELGPKLYRNKIKKEK